MVETGHRGQLALAESSYLPVQVAATKGLVCYLLFLGLNMSGHPIIGTSHQSVWDSVQEEKGSNGT